MSKNILIAEFENCLEDFLSCVCNITDGEWEEIDAQHVIKTALAKIEK